MLSSWRKMIGCHKGGNELHWHSRHAQWNTRDKIWMVVYINAIQNNDRQKPPLTFGINFFPDVLDWVRIFRFTFAFSIFYFICFFLIVFVHVNKTNWDQINWLTHWFWLHDCRREPSCVLVLEVVRNWERETQSDIVVTHYMVYLDNSMYNWRTLLTNNYKKWISQEYLLSQRNISSSASANLVMVHKCNVQKWMMFATAIEHICWILYVWLGGCERFVCFAFLTKNFLVLKIAANRYISVNVFFSKLQQVRYLLEHFYWFFMSNFDDKKKSITFKSVNQVILSVITTCQFCKHFGGSC